MIALELGVISTLSGAFSPWAPSRGQRDRILFSSWRHDIGVSLKLNHGFVLPFLRYTRRTTGNSTVSDLKITHSASCGASIDYDHARDEALQ